MLATSPNPEAALLARELAQNNNGNNDDNSNVVDESKDKDDDDDELEEAKVDGLTPEQIFATEEYQPAGMLFVYIFAKIVFFFCTFSCCLFCVFRRFTNVTR